jgi:hypothetical protein
MGNERSSDPDTLLGGPDPSFGATAEDVRTRYDDSSMKALKARVQGGRLVLDEPTELPEGEVVELVPLDEILANGGDYLDDEERERLHESLRESVRQMEAGQTVDAGTVMEKLRARR